MEQLSAENDTVEEMIEALERAAPSVASEIVSVGACDEQAACPPGPTRQSSKTRAG